MPNDPQQPTTPNSGGEAYSPAKSYPRDIGEDGLPVRKGKPQAQQPAASASDLHNVPSSADPREQGAGPEALARA